MSESPVDLLRRAAEAAPKVLPGPLGEAALLWLRAETACHEAVPETAESARRVLASIAEEISGEEVEVDFSVTVSTLGTAVGFAREVLALAEQQRPVEATVYMAHGIRPDSWLHEDRFAEFRHAYSYASVKTHAIPGLSKITAEEAYYVWRIIQRGFEFNERTKNDPRLGLKEES